MALAGMVIRLPPSRQAGWKGAVPVMNEAGLSISRSSLSTVKALFILLPSSLSVERGRGHFGEGVKLVES